MRTTNWKLTVVSAALVSAAALLLAAPAARAQGCETPYATGVFFEVREEIRCNPGGGSLPNCADTSAKGFGTRIADATLTGAIQGPPEFTGEATIEASSILSKVDWTGPAHGAIDLTNALGNDVRARFAGQLNLDLAINQGVPLAPISGQWNGTAGLKAGGTFSGVFFIPFPCPDIVPADFCFLQPDPVTGLPITPVLPNERSPEGVPLVKLVVSFCNKR